MPGGARNRSGRPMTEGSGHAERHGYVLTALPAAGYDGDVPDFPLPDVSARELIVWAEAWKTPQACAWSLPSESWRVRTVALWVRVTVRCEAPDVPATVLGQLHRFADQIGMTTAGLHEMGWKVEPVATAASKPAVAAPTARRLRSAG